MRLSLLRAPKSPDPMADMGTHHFDYAVMPHAGSLQQAGVVGEGYRFNVPMVVKRTSTAPAVKSYFAVDNPAVVIDTVKKAEDSDEIIVRLYESFGARTSAALHIGLNVVEAVEVNLLEHEVAEVKVEDGKITLPFGAFQLRTLKLKVK
jgi:alpha-mannosidase